MGEEIEQKAKKKRERELRDTDNVVMEVGRKGMGGGGREHRGDKW